MGVGKSGSCLVPSRVRYLRLGFMTKTERQNQPTPALADVRSPTQAKRVERARTWSTKPFILQALRGEDSGLILTQTRGTARAFAFQLTVD